MSDCGCEFEAKDEAQKKVLIWLLLINLSMFFAEFGAGILVQSTALISDSLDMFADAAVYSIGLYAVGRAASVKSKAALFSGIAQILLALFAMQEVVRRFVEGGSPDPVFMIGVGSMALVANVICLKLISKHRDGDVNMRASWIFSVNDVIANTGVIIGGILVYLLDNRMPDLVVGAIIGFIVLRGGVRIILEARKEMRTE